MHAQLEGVKSSPWSLDITPECAGKQPPKLWSRSGTFKKGGILLDGKGLVPENPCGVSDGLELAQKHLPVRKAGDTTSRKQPPTNAVKD